MATLSVRPATRRDRLALRTVRQRRALLAAPWDTTTTQKFMHSGAFRTTATTMFSSDLIVAVVDDEVCAYAIWEPGDERFRWNLSALGAGSSRVDATREVAIELWVALLEEGIRWAGRSGARRLFAYCQPDSVEQESLRQSGFAGFTAYDVLRGGFKRGLRENMPIREQHESDLWSIHQLYNRTTPRPVQFAEAYTSDAWTVEPASRNPFRSRNSIGFVLPTEDGIGAACHIDLSGERPIVTALCDEHLTHAIPSIVADSLDRAAIYREVDVILPAYQSDRASSFFGSGFVVADTVVGTVRHTTASIPATSPTLELLKPSESRSAVPVTYRGLNSLDSDLGVQKGA